MDDAAKRQRITQNAAEIKKLKTQVDDAKEQFRVKLEHFKADRQAFESKHGSASEQMDEMRQAKQSWRASS